MITIYVNFVPSIISDNWLVDHDELVAELVKLMPDVKRYTVRGFKQYKWYRIQEIVRCYNDDVPGGTEGCHVIELNVVPKNL